ncbi:MAG: ParB/RepB/Spo0J family partition protein [Chitinophagaceae bacterium]|nr:ParB/RepB/Spo0J family partition protein [Chitinophagaceae bacterium]
MEKIKSELKHIPLSQVQRNPENPRIVFRQEELDQLLTSIQKIGLQVPISVYRDGNDYIIIDGERRWKTYFKLNYPTIPAIIQPKPTELENLILMFNIHGLREQWDVFTIANKLTRIIDLIKSQTGEEPTETELSTETGLTRGILRRCKLIIALPNRFKKIILEELKKPKKDQIFSEDFFLEMEGALKTVKNNVPDSVKNINDVRDVLMKKYENKVINNITDFRKLAKIATAWKNVEYPLTKIQSGLIKAFGDNKVSIDEVYKETVEALLGDKKLNSNAYNFLQRIRRITSEDLEDEDLKETLLEIKRKLDKLFTAN